MFERGLGGRVQGIEVLLVVSRCSYGGARGPNIA